MYKNLLGYNTTKFIAEIKERFIKFCIYYSLNTNYMYQ